MLDGIFGEKNLLAKSTSWAIVDTHTQVKHATLKWMEKRRLCFEVMSLLSIYTRIWYKIPCWTLFLFYYQRFITQAHLSKTALHLICLR